MNIALSFQGNQRRYFFFTCINFAKMLSQIFKVNSKLISLIEGIKNIPKFAYSKYLNPRVESIVSSCRRDVVLICIDDHALERI